MRIRYPGAWQRAVLLVCVAVTLSVPSAVSAQTRSAIGGTVRDGGGGVLPGVTITLRSPNLVGGAQTAVTNTDGVYRLPELVAGIYEVTAELPGFTTLKRTGLRVASSGTLTVDIVLEVAAIAETVEVTGAAPTVDVRSAAAIPTLDKELLEHAPIATDRRLVTYLIDLVPGAYGRTAFGSARDDNKLMADGVPVGHPRFGGIVGTYGLSQLWFEEVEYVAVGATAEFGEFGGTATNFRLRSGSNVFSGLVDYWRAVPDWTGDNRSTDLLRSRFAPIQLVGQWDASAQVGGPIKKDRIFLFTGVNYSHKLVPSRNTERTVGDERWRRILSKVSWAASPSVKVEGFVSPAHITNTGGNDLTPLGVLARPETALDYVRPSTIFNARLTWTPNSSTLIEIRQSGLDFSEVGDPTAPGSRAGPAPHVDLLTGVSSINRSTFWTDNSNRHLTAANLSRHVDQFWGGSHDLKLGVEYERQRTRREDGFPGGQSFRDFGGAPNEVVLWAGSVTDASTSRATVYSQDRWIVTNKLTLEPGIRISVNRGSVPDRGTVFSSESVAPRFGFAWDVASDHKTVVRAHYGWLSQALSTGSVEFMDTARQTPQITARVLGPDNFVELTRLTPATNLGIAEDLSHPYVEQFQLGIERELFPYFSVQAQYVHRDFKNVLATIDTGSQYAPVQRPEPGPDGLLNTADDGGLLTVYNLLNPGQAFYLLTNPGDDVAYRRYNGLQLIAKKRYADDWQLIGSYSFAKAKGTAGAAQGDHGGFGTDTGRTGVFANPNRAINSLGVTPLVFTHQVKIEGTYRVPLWGGIQANGVYMYISGAGWGRTALIRGLAQGNETVRLEPRGTRESDTLSQLDLRVEKTFTFGSRTAGIYADILNANNWGSPILRFGGSGATEASGPNFGLPTNWGDPRMVQVGLRLTF